MISVFPNPARDNIWIKTDLGMPVLFEIIDIYARVLIVESIDSKLFQFDTSKLKAGLYFYRVRKEEMIYKTGKLLIK